MDIPQMIVEIKRLMDGRGGLRQVFFVACGGSQAAIYPGKYLLDAEATSFGVKIMNSGELVAVAPKALNRNALAICCSLKATRETVEAVRLANARGAVTIAMTGSAHTEMAQVGKYAVVYSNGDDQIYSQSNQSMALRIAFELLRAYENYPHYGEAMAAFAQIDRLIADSKARLMPRARQFAQDFKDDAIFYVLGSGPLAGAAYSMANCHFIEMQCRHAVCIHSGEYFHGPFETTCPDLAMVLFKATGRTRALDRRVHSFLAAHAGRVLVLDARDTGIEQSMGPHVAQYFDPVVMLPLERFFVAQLAGARGRSMDARNYMYKCEY